jgi:oxygen-independent coproporphyrinogen-3 oxidase
MNGINCNFNVFKDAEVTLEANPATLDTCKLDTMLENGVNRLSIGCQSANDNELKTLGRLHSYSDFVATYDLARNAGFSNISVDLMYSLPSQNVDMLKNSLESIVGLSPEHISLYGLKIEPGTQFYINKDNMNFPDEDAYCDMYLMAGEYLESAGYNKYEISNFSKTGKESRHNLKYWNFDQYLGLGPGAHSYLNGKRFAYGKDVQKYISFINEGKVPLKSEDRELSDRDVIAESFMLKMRLVKGVKDFRDYNISEDMIKRYVNGGFLSRDGYAICFTERGFLVSNYILSDLISFD